MYTLRSGVLDVVRLGGYTRCAGADSLTEHAGYAAGDDPPNRQKTQEKWQFDRARRTGKP